MKLTKEQQIGFDQIELRVILQRAIELMDDLEINNPEPKNKKLKSQLKALYGPLDKETRKYNDIFEASEEGTTAFYQTTQANALLVMRNNLLDKSFICQAMMAREINPKAIEGIIDKILKTNK
jgi:septation ring formation regulator EzrA